MIKTIKKLENQKMIEKNEYSEKILKIVNNNDFKDLISLIEDYNNQFKMVKILGSFYLLSKDNNEAWEVTGHPRLVDEMSLGEN